MDQPRRDYFLWMQNIRDRYPDLAARIFALRSQGAPLKFPWPQQKMENTLGWMIQAMTKGHEPAVAMDAIQRYEEMKRVTKLFEDVAYAEKLVQKARYANQAII